MQGMKQENVDDKWINFLKTDDKLPSSHYHIVAVPKMGQRRRHILAMSYANNFRVKN